MSLPGGERLSVSDWSCDQTDLRALRGPTSSIRARANVQDIPT